MLSFKSLSSSEGVDTYYEEDDDYYAKENAQKGQWEGKGAALLGLSGGVDRQMFKNLLDGKLPNGEQIRIRMTKKQGTGKESAPRLGIDFTFSAPKSISIAALVNGDTAIVHAHDAAVRAAIAMLESKAIARKKVGGKSYRQNTHNLVIAAFRHDLSRAQDPQLHTHAVTMNMTQRDDGQWVALTNDDMLKSVKLIGAFYRAELARNLVAQGYAIRTTRDGFELAGVSDAAIDVFSSRSKQVEAALATQGLNRQRASGKVKQKITMATRPKKTVEDRAALQLEWREALQQAGVEIDKAVPQQPGAGDIAPVSDEEGARRAVDFAIEHMAERQGIFSHGELLERAILRSLGSFPAIEAELAKAKRDGRLVTELPLYQSAKSFSREQQSASTFQSDKFLNHNEHDKLTAASWVALTIANTGMPQAQAEKLIAESTQNGRLVRVEDRYTTPAMLAMEQAVLDLEHAGRGAVTPIRTASEVAAMFAGSTLNAGQQSAAALILTTPNRYVGVQGYAGTGKSHMLSAAVDAIKAAATVAARDQGYTVIGLAPYASQNKALAELGMESQTLAGFLLRQSDQAKLNPRAIVFLDESSVVPAHQMHTLMEHIEAAGARLVLVGDIKQTQAVESGKPFDQLQQAGMSTAHLTEVLRQQKPELKAAVVSAAGGKIEDAARKLRDNTVQIVGEDARYAAIAAQYAALSPAERTKTLIVAGTNDARCGINAQVRAALRLPDEHKIDTYDSVDMTRAEKKQAGSFVPGQAILLEGVASQDLESRVYYDITAINDKANRITVRHPDGALVDVDPARLRNISVFKPQTMALSRGDWIRVTRNNNALGIHNGERYQIGAINKDAIQLSNGEVVPRTGRLHMQHGYATTVHSAQGLTTDRVLIDASVKSLTSNRAVFYVAISRPRHDLTIYTDDAGKLGAAMAREPKKFAALELRGTTLEKTVLANAIERQSLRKTAATTPTTKAKAAKVRKHIAMP